jgi:hypothetical protein
LCKRFIFGGNTCVIVVHESLGPNAVSACSQERRCFRYPEINALSVVSSERLSVGSQESYPGINALFLISCTGTGASLFCLAKSWFLLCRYKLQQPTGCRCTCSIITFLSSLVTLKNRNDWARVLCCLGIRRRPPEAGTDDLDLVQRDSRPNRRAW